LNWATYFETQNHLDALAKCGLTVPRQRRGRHRIIRECTLFLLAVATGSEPALASSYLSCTTKKVIIIGAMSESTSSSVREDLNFWIDDAAKTLVLADGTPLTIRQFGQHWISAVLGDFSYELDRQNGALTYAGSTMKEGTATIIIGSGRCKTAAGRAE
jgi:hypothetical protein